MYPRSSNSFTHTQPIIIQCMVYNGVSDMQLRAGAFVTFGSHGDHRELSVLASNDGID